MLEKIITDNTGEQIRIRWDRIRFTIIRTDKLSSTTFPLKKAIILNPREMKDIIEFAEQNLIKERAR